MRYIIFLFFSLYKLSNLIPLDTFFFNVTTDLQTVGASDIEPFRVKGRCFIAIANAVDLTPTTSRFPTQGHELRNRGGSSSSRRYQTNSVVYAMDKGTGKFKLYQNISTDRLDISAYGRNHLYSL